MPIYFKHRSRLHYWLADRSVQSNSPEGLAILETTDGTIADTSVANIVLVTKQGEWLTPSTRNAIHGTTLQRACRLLRETGVKVDSAEFKKEDIFEASEVLLLGTTGCIWNATQLDDLPLGATTNAPKTKWLQSLWADWVGIDVVQQAMTQPTKPK
jgi:branched-subunit amino acid aminotransferase/4-amino-4-deoxychorismate lyase